MCLHSDQPFVYSNIQLFETTFSDLDAFFVFPQQLRLPINLAIGTNIHLVVRWTRSWRKKNVSNIPFKWYICSCEWLWITLIFADCRLENWLLFNTVHAVVFVPTVACWCSFSALWLIRVLNFNLLLICFCWFFLLLLIIRKWFIKEPFSRCCFVLCCSVEQQL